MAQDLDVLVVGAGIAGLSAGLAAARLGRRTLVVTGDSLGGHLLSIERIDGYPGFPDGVPGYDLCPIVQEQAAAAGAEFAMTSLEGLERTDGAWRAAAAGAEYAARAVILATGTALRALGVPGEALLRGKGVSHCASCDAPLLRGQHVVVAGGGDSAMQEALTLAEHAGRITLVHRGATLSGQTSYRSLVESHAKIELCPGFEITEVVGQDAVTGAKIRRADDATTRELDCAAVFVYVGLEPNASIVAGQLALDETGRIPADTAMRTVLGGLFAAGTVRSGSPGRAASAAGDGTAAAVAAGRFLDDGRWPGA